LTGISSKKINTVYLAKVNKNKPKNVNKFILTWIKLKNTFKRITRYFVIRTNFLNNLNIYNKYSKSCLKLFKNKKSNLCYTRLIPF